MNKEQVIVRTYPNAYVVTTENVEKYLRQGYTVVMANTWYNKTGAPQGNEYILEKTKG